MQRIDNASESSIPYRYAAKCRISDLVSATAATGRALEDEFRVKVEKVGLSYPEVGIYVEAGGCAD